MHELLLKRHTQARFARGARQHTELDVNDVARVT